jgi:2-polyprenyl-3-methyl-5-hydroxy-6-metoxy-1,4-benzoquinol methylase
MASQGFQADAFDFSETAIAWATERAHERGLPVHFECKSVFEIETKEDYDFVYDSGCMHHLLPHRRPIIEPDSQNPRTP